MATLRSARIHGIQVKSRRARGQNKFLEFEEFLFRCIKVGKVIIFRIEKLEQ